MPAGRGVGAAGVDWSLVNVCKTFLLDNVDILPGDLLVVSSVEYVIRAAAAWQFPQGSGYYMQLTVEKILQ